MINTCKNCGAQLFVRRTIRNGTYTMRELRCKSCNGRYTTHEVPEEVSPYRAGISTAAFPLAVTPSHAPNAGLVVGRYFSSRDEECDEHLNVLYPVRYRPGSGKLPVALPNDQPQIYEDGLTRTHDAPEPELPSVEERLAALFASRPAPDGGDA